MASEKKPESSGQPGSYRVGPGMWVQLDYRVRDAEGEAVGADVERLTVIFGAGQLLAAVERSIDGLGIGEAKHLKLLARDAYGPRKPDAVLEVDSSEFPSDVEAGDYFEVENADQGLLVLRVLEVGQDFVLVDLNHPLSGQDLDVEVTIQDVRPATQNELDLALQAGIAEDPEIDSSIISPDRLLRGRTRR